MAMTSRCPTRPVVLRCARGSAEVLVIADHVLRTVGFILLVAGGGCALGP